MENQSDRKEGFLSVGTPLCGVVCGLLGAAAALMLIFLGFWKTVLVALFFAAGYLLGGVNGKAEKIKSWINRLFPPKGE